LFRGEQARKGKKKGKSECESEDKREDKREREKGRTGLEGLETALERLDLAHLCLHDSVVHPETRAQHGVSSERKHLLFLACPCLSSSCRYAVLHTPYLLHPLSTRRT